MDDLLYEQEAEVDDLNDELDFQIDEADRLVSKLYDMEIDFHDVLVECSRHKPYKRARR